MLRYSTLPLAGEVGNKNTKAVQQGNDQTIFDCNEMHCFNYRKSHASPVQRNFIAKPENPRAIAKKDKEAAEGAERASLAEYVRTSKQKRLHVVSNRE